MKLFAMKSEAHIIEILIAHAYFWMDFCLIDVLCNVINDTV